MHRREEEVHQEEAEVPREKEERAVRRALEGVQRCPVATFGAELAGWDVR